MSGACALRFAVSGGRATGLGHVARCAEIAREARERGHRVAFALDGDATAHELLRAELPGAPVTTWEHAAGGGAGDWTVFDARRELADALRAVRRAGARALVLDTLAYVDVADLTVLPVLHGPPCDHPRVLQGGAFCVIGQAARAIAADDAPEARELALVTLGGADPLGLTERVAAGLDACLARSPEASGVRERHCAIGPAFAGAERLAATLVARGWTVHRGLSRGDLAALARRARLAVAGFGTGVYELAYLGVPVAYATHRAEDGEAARRLEGRGLGALAAEGPAFEPVAFEAALRRTLLDPRWRAKSARRGRALLGDGHGARRILDALGLRTAAIRGCAA